MVYGNNSSVVTEDYLAGCKAAHDIPSYASLDEMMYFVIEASEEDFNNIMMEAGITELQYYEENHVEYVYEEGKIKSLVDTVVKAFTDMWKRIQEMIQNAIDAINKKAMDFRSKIMAKLDTKILDAKVKGIKDNKSFGKGYDFADVKTFDEKNKLYRKYIKDAEKNVQQYYDKASSALEANGKASVEDLDSQISDRISRCVSNICDHKTDITSASNISKYIKAQLRGDSKDWTGADVKRLYKDNILVEVTNFPETKRQLKSDYNELKKDFNNTIAEVKKAGKKAETKPFEASIFSKAIKGYKSLKQIATVCEQASISVLNERYNFYRSIILRLIGSSVKKESAMVSESSTSDAIDSLFNW